MEVLHILLGRIQEIAGLSFPEVFRAQGAAGMALGAAAGPRVKDSVYLPIDQMVQMFKVREVAARLVVLEGARALEALDGFEVGSCAVGCLEDMAIPRHPNNLFDGFRFKDPISLFARRDGVSRVLEESIILHHGIPEVRNRFHARNDMKYTRTESAAWGRGVDIDHLFAHPVIEVLVFHLARLLGAGKPG